MLKKPTGLFNLILLLTVHLLEKKMLPSTNVKYKIKNNKKILNKQKHAI